MQCGQADSGGASSSMRHSCLFHMYSRLKKIVQGNDSDPQHRNSVVATANSNVQHSSSARDAATWQAWLHSIIESPYLANFFLLAIIVNSVLLGICLLYTSDAADE